MDENQNLIRKITDDICSFSLEEIPKKNSNKILEENDYEINFSNLLKTKNSIENFIKKQEKEYIYFFTKIKKQNQTLEVVFSSKRYLEKFFVKASFLINLSRKEISMIVFYCEKTGEPIIVHDLGLKLLLTRYFTRLNGTFRLGSFSIFPPTGQIIFKITPFVKNTAKLILGDANFQNIFEVFFYTATHAVTFHFYKIMYMINEISENLYLKVSRMDQDKKIRILQPEHNKPLNEIVKYLKICNQEFDKNKLGEENFKFPKNIQNSENFVFSRIDIIEIEKEFNFMAGGFAEIFKAKVKLKTNKGNIIKTLAIKKDKKKENLVDETHESNSSHVSRISNEKRILSKLQNVECPFIAKFYYSDNRNYDNMIFMDFYTNKSLDNFKNIYSLTISLQTKLYFLYQIAMGIYFLHNKGIYHLDIKPANVLVSKNYVCKLIDFGESYFYTSELEPNFRPGRTLPFAAPEIFASKFNVNPKFDVFSFGVLLCELIFDIYPMNFRRNNLNALQNKYFKGNYYFAINEKNIKKKGPKHLLCSLRNLALKCTEFSVEDRCSIEHIITILKSSMHHLDRNY